MTIRICSHHKRPSQNNYSTIKICLKKLSSKLKVKILSLKFIPSNREWNDEYLLSKNGIHKLHHYQLPNGSGWGRLCLCSCRSVCEVKQPLGRVLLRALKVHRLITSARQQQVFGTSPHGLQLMTFAPDVDRVTGFWWIFMHFLYLGYRSSSVHMKRWSH